MYRQLLSVCPSCVAAGGLSTGMDKQMGMSFLWEGIQKIQSLWTENKKEIKWVMLREIWDNWRVINNKCNNINSDFMGFSKMFSLIQREPCA